VKGILIKGVVLVRSCGTNATSTSFRVAGDDRLKTAEAAVALVPQPLRAGLRKQFGDLVEGRREVLRIDTGAWVNDGDREVHADLRAEECEVVS
jgi:hypothetical protein